MESNNHPLVSFCIPTYNRATYLEATLQSYVSCVSFDNRVEVIISDNHSTDGTQFIGEEYAKKYPNIRYFRNEENINDANFPLALDRANGEYLKLMNDNIHITKEGLSSFISFIEKMKKKRIPVFCCVKYFNHKKNDVIDCKTADEFAIFASRSCTAISMFGAWKEDWEKVVEPLKYSKLRLSQVDWCYQILNLKKQAKLYTLPISTKKIDIGMKRGGYNWFEVQVKNYYLILQTYVDKGLISNKAIQKEKTTCLLNIMPWIAVRYWLPMYYEWQFEWKGATKNLWNAFKENPIFYMVMSTIPIWANYYYLKYHIRQFMIKLGKNVR